MKTHDSHATSECTSDQTRRGPTTLMQVHENHYIKRAGVAGLRVRALGLNGADRTNLEELDGPKQGEISPLWCAVETQGIRAKSSCP